jgi:hemerythrin
VGFITRSRLARERQIVRLEPGQTLEQSATPSLYLVREGALELTGLNGRRLETVEPGGFVGEERLLGRSAAGWACVARGPTELFEMAAPELRRIPIVLWKLLETHDRRQHSMKLGG